jgi:hypothetical protein
MRAGMDRGSIDSTNLYTMPKQTCRPGLACLIKGSVRRGMHRSQPSFILPHKGCSCE